MDWLDLNLTMEQELMMRHAKDAVPNMKREELEKTFLELVQLYQIYKNINAQLMKQIINLQFEGIKR